MQIEITEQVPSTRIIEIVTPQFRTTCNCIFYAITDESVIVCTEEYISITGKHSPREFQNKIIEVISQEKAEPEEFNKVFLTALAKITEQHTKICIEELQLT